MLFAIQFAHYVSGGFFINPETLNLLIFKSRFDKKKLNLSLPSKYLNITPKITYGEAITCRFPKLS